MKIKTVKSLKILVKKLFLKAGADKRNANMISESLVTSNLYGVDTHGIFMIPAYIKQIKVKELNPAAWPEIVKENQFGALVKGNWTFGQVTARYAMDIAIKKAKKNGMSIVSGVQVMHTGRIGEYAEIAAENKMISLIWNGGYSEEGAAEAVPYGGRKVVLHTNPFAMGFPAGKEPPMISDFATTAVAGVKIAFAREGKKKLPEGSIIDKNGNPSCEPEDFYNGGGHMPFGGHKGYAIMLANEFLGRIFSGSDSYIDENHNHIIYPALKHSGFTLIVFKPDLFNPFEEYSAKMDEFERRVRAVPPAKGFKEVHIPGDLRRKAYKDRVKNGIPIPDHIWESLEKAARSLGTEID